MLSTVTSIYCYDANDDYDDVMTTLMMMKLAL